MSWRKTANNKYRIEIETTVNKERFRVSKVVTTSLTGLELKSLMNMEELKLIEELKVKASDPDKISRMTLEEYFNIYLERNDFQESTKDWYRKYMTIRTIDYFGDTPVSKITESDMQDFFKMLRSTISDMTKKHMSPKTISHYRTVLHAIFKSLVEKNIIKTNPVSNILTIMPKRTLNNKFYTPEEVSICVEKLQQFSNKTNLLIFVLLVTTGIRPAEAYGLKWNKIDFQKKQVLIDKTLAKTSKGYIYKDTKTEDTRLLNLTDYLITLLKAHKIDEINKLPKRKNMENDYVITNSNGRHLGSTYFRNFWKDFCSKHNIRYVPPYGLRHTTATLLAFNNIPMINIARQLGHTNTTTTEIYTHAVDSINAEIKGIMENTIKPKMVVIK